MSPSFSSIDHWLLQRVLRAIQNPPLRLVLGDAEAVAPGHKEIIGTVAISDRRTLVELALSPEIGFGDAYTEGRLEIHGDFPRMLEAVIGPMQRANAGGWFTKLTSRWLQKIQANTRTGSARNIHRHYDLMADFYRLWLDSCLVYTCAYFPDTVTSLEEAQLAKMDYVCRKLNLRPGETVIEAGCGWGALALHMARNYGARVRAFNISHEQILVARERAKKEGLSDRVEFIEDDYRSISGSCDVFVSVGMLEHVGAENYDRFGGVIHRSIGDSGRGLLHFIGRNRPHAFSPWIRKNIFPGAYAPALGQAIAMFEPWDLAVLDVENLRLHYARTLEHWLARFERSAKRVSEMFSAEFVRGWRLYLAGSLASFRAGNLQLFQVVFAGSKCRAIPFTRAHLYAEEPAGQEAKWMHAAS
jgi:cyclopropane-fatty-acyl-phospholipid synthase